MPIDPHFAQRIRTQLIANADLSERKMFGGMGFMLAGNMAAGIMSDGALLVRTWPEDSEELAARPGASLMEQRGRAMRGWVLVSPEVLEEDAALAEWVALGVAYARSLPAK